MGQFESTTSFDGDPQKILDLLTDPEAVRSWSPIAFEVEDLEGDRLRTGTFAHIAGRLGGRRMSFDIEVHKASDGQFILRAEGPVKIQVHYGIEPAEDGEGSITAYIEVASGGGIIGRLAASATDAVLAAGALEQTVKKIAAAAKDD